MVSVEGAIARPTACTWEFRPYLRPFRTPLITHHGEWRDREGILLQLTATDGRTSYGEIAPLPWFGSETMEQAIALCQRLPAILDAAIIGAIPNTLPAAQFGFESAWAGFTAPPQPIALPQSALLPAGEIALTQWHPLWQQGFRTFKWKIGVADLALELAWFQQLKQQLPATARLRLDANGGLTIAQAAHWLTVCDRLSVEYLEQPLPPSQFREMLALQAQHSTAIALDESVATVAHLQTCLDHGWTGVVVIKPAIAGSPTQLHRLFQQSAIDAVFSSVFETPIGQQAGLQLAATLGNRDRAHGYGTSHWFNDALSTPHLSSDALWQRL